MERRSVSESGFRPRATLGIFYFFGFVMLFCAIFVGPELLRGFRAVSADATQWESSQHAVQQALGSRFWIAVLLAAVATVVGGRLRLLPGTRSGV